MSRFTVRSTSRRSSRTPFCGICKKAGKTQQEFTSHFVKNAPNGEVVCPTLLSTECRYCHDFGHTKAHCPKLLEKASRQAFHGKQQRANDKKRKAENRLRAQVEAAQAEKGNTFLEMSFGRTSIRMPIKCQPVSKKARKTAALTSSFANAFYSDSDSDDEEQVQTNGPAVAQPRQLIGAWGNGAAAIAQPATTSKPQSWKKSKRVTFKHDNAETLMKPIAAETRTYLKGSPTNAFVEKPKAPVLKTSPNAWKPSCAFSMMSSYDTALQCDEELRTSASGRTVRQIEASIKEVQEELDDCDHSSTNWSDKGDIEDLQDKLSELEDELKAVQPQKAPEKAPVKAPVKAPEKAPVKAPVKDQFGRPTADNSAW